MMNSGDSQPPAKENRRQERLDGGQTFQVVPIRP